MGGARAGVGTEPRGPEAPSTGHPPTGVLATDLLETAGGSAALGKGVAGTSCLASFAGDGEAGCSWHTMLLLRFRIRVYKLN